MEFIVAIFLFLNGAYILVFESYGAIRAVMMCIHAYFHIFLQAKKGYSVYMKRRTAWLKIAKLTVFNKQYLASVLNETVNIDLDAEFEKRGLDVCAICFCELKTAETRVTVCNHLFHSWCLKRWLHVQSSCPMCQKVVD